MSVFVILKQNGNGALVHTGLCLRMALLHHRHRLYSALDDLLDICGVYKVETIGGEDA